MKGDTTKFTKTTLLYDDPKDGFAIAKGIWDGQETAIGARWYEEGGLGYPQTYGKPQWFIFPQNIGKIIEFVLSILKTVKNMA